MYIVWREDGFGRRIVLYEGDDIKEAERIFNQRAQRATEPQECGLFLDRITTLREARV